MPRGSLSACQDVRPQTLPPWLAASADYVPQQDNDGFLRKNILSVMSALLVLRYEAPRVSALSLPDKLLAQVRPSLRLTGMLLLVTCVSLARNMAFVWVVLACWLTLVALKPAQHIRLVFVPALLAAGMALLVNVPALWFGQSTAPLRMATKALVTMGLVANLGVSLGTDGLLTALRRLRVPRRLMMMLDIALRDVVLLGESALSLSEALALRSVGKDHAKTASAAGVMGMVFLRAHTRAAARAEAMELRGYEGAAPALEQPAKGGPADVGYGVLVGMLVGLFVYLEMALS